MDVDYSAEFASDGSLLPAPSASAAAEDAVPATQQKKFRRGRVEDTDAAVLQLGEDFNSAECLFVTEVQLLLRDVRQKKIQQMGEKSLGGVFQKVYAHAEQFSRFKDDHGAQEVRRTVNRAQLAPFEAAQLANLCCEDPDEAKSLIPSLAMHIDDERLQTLLTEIQSFKKS
ncbi:HRDC-like protein [Syncephalis pseudoplumigaleata]|uniref:HRDC-like protein n=1 Tax=Syncephalis pseudoplumigaleata TaxID=1712513 RepID=A0A4P9Z5X8_9FUNG|nr:HRDC-like protein [Syncephalis pseudoplumigaleata]|eukprot:RKP28053.1 HRDC-like protein [Syncephalis pseudoplumigaleata]